MSSLRTKILLAAGCAAGLAVSVSLLVSNHRARRRTESLLSRLSLQESALQSALAEAETAAVRSGHARGEARQFQTRASARPSWKFVIFRDINEEQQMALVARTPRMRPLAEKAYRAAFRERYRPFYLAANLRPNEIDRLESLDSARVDAQLDIYAAAASENLPENDPAVAGLLEQEDEQALSSIRDLLGESNYRLFASYNPSMEGALLSIAYDSAASNTPLSAPAAAQLMGILIHASSQYQAGGTASLDTVDWPDALAQARGILTPPQFAALNHEYALFQIRGYEAQFDAQELGN